MSFKEDIIHLTGTTDMSNREIADLLGCNIRTVQHFGPGYSERQKEKQAAVDERLPRVLLLDVETSPMEVYAWRLFKQSISPAQVIKDWSILTWSAKWFMEPDVLSARVSPNEAFNREDASVLQGIWNLMEEADIIIAQNGKAFDIKKLNLRFLLKKMGPPSPYQVVDTLIEARKTFAFSSAKLDYMCKQTGLNEQKETQGYDLWPRCVRDNPEVQEQALKDMSLYCDQDVRALEDLYMLFRPWIRSHPNMGVYVETDDPICPTCANRKLTWCGYYMTMVSSFRAFRCDKCGAIGRRRQSRLPLEVRKQLTASIAR